MTVPESLAEECVATIYNKEYQRTETHEGQEYGDPDDESSITTVISYNLKKYNYSYRWLIDYNRLIQDLGGGGSRGARYIELITTQLRPFCYQLHGFDLELINTRTINLCKFFFF